MFDVPSLSLLADMLNDGDGDGSADSDATEAVMHRLMDTYMCVAYPVSAADAGDAVDVEASDFGVGEDGNQADNSDGDGKSDGDDGDSRIGKQKTQPQNGPSSSSASSSASAAASAAAHTKQAPFGVLSQSTWEQFKCLQFTFFSRSQFFVFSIFFSDTPHRCLR